MRAYRRRWQKSPITTPRHGTTVTLVLVAAVAAIGGLLFGYDTGVISGALLFIDRDFALDGLHEGWVAGAVTLGALVGATGAGIVADRIGRRVANMAAGVLFIAGSLLGAFAGGVQLLVAGRLIVGLAIGVTSVAAPMYIAEMAPARIRGALVSLFQLAVTIGILLAYVIDAALSSGSWRWMLGLAAIPGALLLLGMLGLPESPRWLVKRGRTGDARAVLTRVRAGGAADGELASITADVAYEQTAPWSELLSPTVRPALVVGVGLAVLQQVTGINTVISYAPQLFETAGFASADAALWATMGLGVVNVLSTIIAIGLVDRAGRRPLLVIGLGGMVASLAVLGAAFRGEASAGGLGAATVACLALYIAFFAFSMGPIVWLMISEIYPTRIRARAIGIATAANWGANFLVTLTVPALRETLGSGPTFWLFALFGVLGIAFVLRRVPETKGKSLEEIERVWVRQLASH